MMAADSLHVAVHWIVPSGVQIQWLCACHRACSASASALHSALPSHVQASCLERAWPAVLISSVRGFPGALATRAVATPGRHCRERMREAGVQGKIEGCGTTVRAKPVCTWVLGGTRHKAAACRQWPQCLIGIGPAVCRIRWGAMGLAGAAP